VRFARLRPVGVEEEKMEQARALAKAKIDKIKAKLGF
jgi:hypothetical protein